MDRLLILTLSAVILPYLVQAAKEKETILSTVLTPDTKEKTLSRQGRSYYDQRYGALYGDQYAARPAYADRLEYARPEYDRPTRCGRCYDDRYDDRDDDRPGRDRYDDDRRVNHRPTYGNRLDKNKNYDDDDDSRRFNNDRKNSNKNGTEDETDKDKDNKSSGTRRGSNRDRNRVDDRDRYRPDYYDRFLRDPYRERPYEDPYRERRPLFDRYDEPYGGRYDGYPGYRRPVYDNRYDRGNGYDDIYGGYGPAVGRGPHDSFRPWDETYRGQAGWDAGGRGYYFASGRPDAAPAAAWGRPEYARGEAGWNAGSSRRYYYGSGRPDAAPAAAWGQPQYVRPETTSGWQNIGYAGGYRDPLEYRGTVGYGQDGYRQSLDAGYGQADAYGGYAQGYGQGSGQGYGQGSGQGYGQASGWHNVGERRPYRDQSGVNNLDTRETYGQSTRSDSRYDQNKRQPSYGQHSGYGERQQGSYGQGQQGSYGQGQKGSYGQGQPSSYQSTGTSTYSSSTTPQTSYLYQRDNEQVTGKADVTTKSPS